MRINVAETHDVDDADADVEEPGVRENQAVDSDDVDVENAEAVARAKAKGMAKRTKKRHYGVFGTAVAYREPFHSFPGLKHHAHPLLVINDALPKLQKYKADLPE